jgi:hypothetical protein
MKQILMTLKQVIFDIFGDMFFLFPEEYDEEVDFPTDWIKYRAKITNDNNFFINLYFTPGQAKTMTENFLGMEAEDISADITAGTLKEAVNVVGGNLLNRMGKDYNLGIPGQSPTENAAQLKKPYDRNPGEAILLNIEEEPFLATVTTS